MFYFLGEKFMTDVAVSNGVVESDKVESTKPETSVETKTKPETKEKPKSIVAKAIAKFEAVKNGDIMSIPLQLISDSVNPRNEPTNLVALGYSFRNLADLNHSLLDMCLSDNIDTVRAVVELFEEHESNDFYSDQKVKSDLSDATGPDVDRQSIVALAMSISEYGQLENVTVRKSGNNKYTLIYGQRRVMAAAYAYAKNAVDKADKKPATFKNVGNINATILKVSDEEAWELAVRENFDRKNFDAIQEGQIYFKMTQRINPKTGKKYNLREVAEKFGKQYMTVRNRRSLAMPFKADKLDAKGNVVEYGRGLTREQKEDVAAGRKTLSWAVKTANREKHYSESGERKAKRDRPLTLSSIQELFDATPAKNVERRAALAECMQKSLKTAERESAKRLSAADEQVNRKAVKKAGRKLGKKQ